MNKLLQEIASQNHLQLSETVRLSGGDINDVFLLKCPSESYVVKLNCASKFPDLFEAEAKGLQLLTSTNSFKIPSVIAEGSFENSSYLLMEYIPSGKASAHFWTIFAEKLAALHGNTQQYFGLDHNNYIGNLPQTNKLKESPSEFYITQRLEPQLRLAETKGYSFSNMDAFFKNSTILVPNEPPSLIHGDLWNGNYMIDETGAPVLIDPAAAFAPREMDLAMMQLFGGFSDEVYFKYHEIFPLYEGFKERTSLWQLYYLLVHLNLFGSSYFSQVKAIIKKYS
ncbi:hypothetical protein ATE92_1477 [Ulvibacter sp. MAR_2010_11]|uniref:fructosamine kinase family protein n=1 Tax=Ulvibacter sp. MAR_2010_11 TaxID=1250229 RepID=UPI000C2BF04E|nr:fructosamine kinase family protein [Ulvibacter sp. MAR_2010_11]PKA83325.1 hypothetical protein ATE92_1477 [Ulvibacter sp. MAR_2010_11]